MKKYFKIILSFFTCLLLCGTLCAQLPATCYRLTFSDKANSPYSIDNPS